MDKSSDQDGEQRPDDRRLASPKVGGEAPIADPIGRQPMTSE